MTMAVTRASWAIMWVLHAVQTAQGQVTTCTAADEGRPVRGARNSTALSRALDAIADKDIEPCD